MKKIYDLEFPIRLLSLWIILTLWCFTAPAQVLEQDSLALVAFYNSTGGSNWNNNSNWLTGPVSTWYGVTVEGDKVIELEFHQNNLQGSIPIEVGDLKELKMLIIGHEYGLTGSIPDEVGNLQLLVGLGIGNCSLTGAIPSTIGNCSCLEFINLWENNLIGPIPPEIGNLDSLMFLDLHDNQLTGPIPPELGNCTNLSELRLNNNLLTGTIPEEITLLNNIFILDLHSNQLSGELPAYLSNLFTLVPEMTINIGSNLFSGPVPQQWSSTPLFIDALNLSNNLLTSLPVDCNWSFTFFHIEGNKLTFEHIEPHYQAYQQGAYWHFYYFPQDDMLQEIDTALAPGSSYSIYSGTGGDYTNYKWYKNGEMILESPDADTLRITDISYTDTGMYSCLADNSIVNSLYLYRKPVHISIDTSGVGMIENYAKHNKIKLFPNPTNNFVNIYIAGKPETIHLEIFNLAGRCVLKQYQNQNTTLDISHLKPGIYLLYIQTATKNYSNKLIIRKNKIL
ncbi:MAG: T9SS type A sorting domain-containing protein [Clostridia bacterium]|nr:T9SS type A sorting domain-containing protein [Clostridia bacterium]